jgi:LCP family protein required for cell wall assembly
MDRKRVYKTVYLVALFILAVAMSYFWRLYSQVYIAPRVIAVEANATPTPTPDPLGVRNILILGYGGAGHEGGALADTIILAHVKPRDKEIDLISIPRDIWVPIEMKDGEENFKINHAFAIGLDENRYPNKLDKYKGIAGGGLLAKESASLVTGLDVQNFISVNFAGFTNIIDYLGGVDVYVPYSFKDEFYPIKGEEDNACGKSDENLEALEATMSGQKLEEEFKCRFETIEYQKGLQHLDSESALKYVRSRHSAIGGSDFGRSLRQQSVIVAVKNKLLNFGSIGKLIPVLNTIAKNTQTDIDLKSAFDIMADYGTLDDVEIRTISLNTDNVFKETVSSDGQYILLPKAGEGNWDEIQRYIERELSR